MFATAFSNNSIHERFQNEIHRNMYEGPGIYILQFRKERKKKLNYFYPAYCIEKNLM